MTDKPKTVRESLGPNARFADALAAHLADVRNADEAHRIIRPPQEQKLEALTRCVAELWEQVLLYQAREDAAGEADLERMERE